MNLNGKTAIVTGVSVGIGKSTAEALLAKGAKVAGWSRRDPGIDHPNFQFYPTDVSDIDQVNASFDATITKFRTVDVVINNAGFGTFAPFEDETPENWEAMFRVNVHGIFYVCRRAIPVMRAQKAGHIINIASIAALQGVPQAAGYCGTKFAVRGISDTIYKEVKDDNIKVTCIYPGSVNTEFFNEIEQINANESMLWPEDIAQSIIDVVEMRDNVAIQNLEIRPMNPKY